MNSNQIDREEINKKVEKELEHIDNMNQCWYDVDSIKAEIMESYYG